jgi:hypothetical protein
MREGVAGPTVPPELLAFSHWAAISDSAVEALTRHLPEQDVRFIWPRVQPNLHAGGVLIGPSAIEIRPYNPPTQTLPGYRNARQRLYLSATLGTMDDLQRRLGVARVINVLDEPTTSGQVGNRLFLLYPEASDPLTEGPLDFTLSLGARAGRVAWLCASHSEADQVQVLLAERGLTSYRLRRGGDDGALERWSTDRSGHLVTAGRFDGFDLAGELCRLVVLPSTPAASTEFERFVMAYLADATFMRHRVGQRVTQALGRANRSEGDWAMYLGLDPGFGTLLAQSAVRQAITADVRPDVDAALARLQSGWVRAQQDMREFWSSAGALPAPSGVAASRGRARPGRARAAANAGSANDEVTAVTRLWLGDPAGAAEAASRASAILAAAGEVEHAAFWRYVQAQASFEAGGPSAIGRAIEALRTAIQSAAATAWFVRLTRVLDELRGVQVTAADEQPWANWDEWIAEASSTGVRRAVDKCRERLAGTHDQQAEGLEILGRMVGVVASHPTGSSVTDAVWNWPGPRRIERRLWEVKTGNPDAIPRDWVDQALGQIADARPNPRLRVVGCILTHLTEVERDAGRAAADTLCLVHQSAVITLANMLGDRLIDYASRYGFGSAAERGAAREAVEGRLPRGPWLADLLNPSNGRLIDREDIISLFPSN